MTIPALIASVRATEAEFGPPSMQGYVAFTKAAERYPDLTLAEERMLAAARDKNPAAKQALFACKMRKVARVLHQFRNSGLDEQDLIAEGCLALHKAVEKFDAGDGAAFNTYAVALIRGGVYELLMSQRNETKIPKNSKAMRLVFKIKGIMKDMDVDRLSVQQAEVIAKEFETDVEDVACVLRAMSKSITAYVNEDGEVCNPADCIADAGIDVEEEVAAKQEADRMLYAKKKVLDALSDRDREILEARFAAEKETMSSIAKRLNLSMQRVNEIEKRVLKQIKAAYEAAR